MFCNAKYRVRCHGVTEGFGNKLTIASICECMIGSVSVSGEMLKNWRFVESRQWEKTIYEGRFPYHLLRTILKRFAPAFYETKRRGECCYGSICIDYLPLSITRVAFFKPLDVASRVIFPGSSVDDTMAVIMPENTFMWGARNDSNDVGSPLAPAR